MSTNNHTGHVVHGCTAMPPSRIYGLRRRIKEKGSEVDVQYYILISLSYLFFIFPSVVAAAQTANSNLYEKDCRIWPCR